MLNIFSCLLASSQSKMGSINIFQPLTTFLLAVPQINLSNISGVLGIEPRGVQKQVSFSLCFAAPEMPNFRLPEFVPSTLHNHLTNGSMHTGLSNVNSYVLVLQRKTQQTTSAKTTTGLKSCSCGQSIIELEPDQESFPVLKIKDLTWIFKQTFS